MMAANTATGAASQQHQLQQQQLPPDTKSYSAAEENRHYLKVFIQTYRNLPILWDTTLRDYSNRDKRAEAYEQLVPIYRYLKRDANLLDVKKKINTLRTNYRKELKMIDMSRKQGSVYQPRCWTFYDLDFLRNAEKFLAVDPNQNIKTEPPPPNSSPSQFSMFNESTHQGNFLEISPYGFRMNNGASPPPSITQMFQKSFGQNNNVTHTPKQQQTALSLQTPPLERQDSKQSQSLNGEMAYDQQLNTSPSNNQQMSSLNVENNNKRFKLSAHAMSSSSSPVCICSASNTGEEEALTRTWAYKLKRLTREQRLYAEKFINDILFEAETGTLHRGSMQLNAFEPYVRFEEPHGEDETSNTSHDKSQSPQMVASNSPANCHLPGQAAIGHSQSHEVGDVKNIKVQESQCVNENSGSHTTSFHNYN